MGILWEWKKFMLHQGTLYHCHTLTRELKEVMQLIVPTAHHVVAMNGCHKDAGHQGQQQTLSLLQNQFWWSGMDMQMQRVISNCKSCIQHEGAHAKAPLQPIFVTAPLELLHVDFTSIEMMMELEQPLNIVDVLVFCDYFMKHIMAYVTPDQSAKTVAKFLWQGYISIFRTPSKLLSDRGANFESNIIKELCELKGILKAKMLLYHAQANRQVEQAQQTLMRMIGKLSKDQKADWPKYLPELDNAIIPWDQLLLGMAHTTWWFGADHTYPWTSIFPQLGAWKTPACWSLCCRLMWMTVGSLQGDTSTVHIWGWEAEVLLWL